MSLETNPAQTSTLANYGLAKLKSAERYSPWSFFVQTVLEGEDLWDIVTGDEPCPPINTPTPTPLGSQNATPLAAPVQLPAVDALPAAEVAQDTQVQPAATLSARDRRTEAIRKWRQRDAKSRMIILKMLDESLFAKFRNYATAQALWNAIRESYEDASSQNILLWWTDLTRARLDDGNAVQPHVDRILDASRKLSNAKFPIPEPILAIIILSSLPDSWNTLVTSLHTTLTASSGKDRDRNFTPKFVIDRLLEHEKMMTIRGDSGGSALAVNREKLKKPKSKQTMRDSEKQREACGNCSRTNHATKDCRAAGGAKYKPRDDKPAADKSKKANVASTTNLNYESDEAKAMVAGAGPSDRAHSQGKDWVIDSGASSHLTSDRNSFTHYSKSASDQSVRIGDNTKLSAPGVGTVTIPSGPDADCDQFHLRMTMHVPDLAYNLMSVSKLAKHGNLTFTEKGCYLKSHTGEVLLTGVCRDGLYYLSYSDEKAAIATALVAQSKPAPIDIGTAHRRLGHLNAQGVRMLARGDIATGMSIDGTELPDCAPCALGKSRRNPIPKEAETKQTRVLELVYRDLVGPINPGTPGGAHYALELVDGKSRHQWQYLLAKKSDAAAKFDEWLTMVERESGEKLGAVRCDNGTEFTGQQFRAALVREGITLQLSAPYAHHQIGVVERSHQTVFNRTRAVLSESQLPKTLWGEISAAIVYLKNRSPTVALHGRTPYEAYHGKIPSLRRLRALGCKAFAHRSKEIRKSKLEERATEGKLVGYEENSKCYRIWDGRKIIRSIDVTFHEKQEAPEHVIIEEKTADPPSPPTNPAPSPSAPNITPSPSTIVQQSTPPTPPAEEPTSEVEEEPTGRPRRANAGRNTARDTFVRDNETSAQDLRRAMNLRITRSYSTREPLDELDAQAIDSEAATLARALIAKTDALGDPKSYAESQKRVDATDWHSACLEEMTAHEVNGTWDLVELPKGKTLHSGMWVFLTKYKDGIPYRKKSRFVFDGRRQIWELGHYEETASPTVKLTSVRVICGEAASNRWKLYQLDFDNAYLNGEIDVELYMRQPTGFVVKGKENLVCRLRKSLYGLKQAGRVWYQKLDEELQKLGFTRCDSEACVYRYHDAENGITIIVAVYVDDTLLTGHPPSAIIRMKADLRRVFRMKDLGEASHLLNITIYQSPDSRFIELSQCQYIIDVLKRFGCDKVHPAFTPMEPNFPSLAIAHVPSESEDYSHIPYQAAVGCIMYLMICTCPDLAFPISVLSQYSTRYTDFHWKGIIRLFRYLQYRKDWVLRFDGDAKSLVAPSDPIVGYSDADWAGDLATRRSTSGYTFIMSGAAVCWKSRKQQSVATSTAAAEYVALGDTTKEALWLRSLLTELGILKPGFPTRIMVDNEACVSLAYNPLITERSKHIDIRHHFVRDCIVNEEIYLKYCPTADMTADIFTKALERVKHARFVHSLGIRDKSISSGGSD